MRLRDRMINAFQCGATYQTFVEEFRRQVVERLAKHRYGGLILNIVQIFATVGGSFGVVFL